MNSDKEKSMNKGDHSDSSSKVNSQQNQKSDKKQSDNKADGNQQASGSGQSKFSKGQPEDKNKKR